MKREPSVVVIKQAQAFVAALVSIAQAMAEKAVNRSVQVISPTTSEEDGDKSVRIIGEKEKVLGHKKKTDDGEKKGKE